MNNRNHGQLAVIAGSALVAAMAAAAPSAAQNSPGVDIQVQKSCDLYPANGPTAIRCRIDVGNIGAAASVAPLSIVDTPTGPAGTTYLGSSNSSFPCTTPTGALPGAINCGANLSLSPGAPMTGGSSGSTFIDFALPRSGGTFRNCARATGAQNPAIPGEANLRNNQSCVSITVPPAVLAAPDLSVGKTCTKGANRSLTCTITIRNNGSTISGPITVTDTLMGPLPGTSYTGAGGSNGVTCGAAQNPYATPISCTLPPIPGGQDRTVLLSFTVPRNGNFSNAVAVNQGGPAREANVINNGTIVRVTMP